ncbi:unnamed protein product [Eruca vesicaria subsp. sativa]|uniref:Uncharacterized protein n=1 Tax=Eruca vesicaria subsp. sativa TaxID=29727 RepID=A0ABC8K5F1_ERUVS|nr:unnamed protein product [Eruca vesicaria subsp. sativa]
MTFMLIHLFSALKKRCSLVSVMADVDRMLRAQGTFIVRDDIETKGEIDNMMESLMECKNDTFPRWKRSDLCSGVKVVSYMG